ncbi:expressed unknown protein [Seminavis robusta]|uniref:Uncharacterized protein n=1 Tax=Seminavis robusta TaxID=568900 RepID=A0A9N8HG94_9STRA|nr:expressed unknown protein [Seminavis robusta]|eukprot:Sro472_g149880.1 n/a (336) ;mRNA; f:13368-14375
MEEEQPTKKRSRIRRIVTFPYRRIQKLLAKRRAAKAEQRSTTAATTTELVNGEREGDSKAIPISLQTAEEDTPTSSVVEISFSDGSETHEDAETESTSEVTESTLEVTEPVDQVNGFSATISSSEALEEETETETSDADTTAETAAETSTSDDNNDNVKKWATAAPSVDLTGDWELLITDEFKREYDDYLRLLDQPAFVRSVALSIVGLTTEETIQKDGGRNLFIRGRNVRGVWERTLSSTGDTEESYIITTADNEQVQAESWWEDAGTKHRSWLRGVSNYGGGSFESLRYLETAPNKDTTEPPRKVLVCESTFHPDDTTREKAHVTWRFQRKQP